MPRVSLFLNDKLISSDLYSFEEVKENGKKVSLKNIVKNFNLNNSNLNN